MNLRDDLLWAFQGPAHHKILRLLFQVYLDGTPPPSARELAYEVDREPLAPLWSQLSDDQRRAIPDERITQLRIVIHQLRDSLKNYFEKSLGRNQPVKVTIPPQGSSRREPGYRLLFDRRKPEPEESARHFWSPYFPSSDSVSERANLVVFTEPLFFRADCDGELTYIRNIHANQAANPSKVERLLAAGTPSLTPSYHYLAAGEVMAVLYLFSLFQRHNAMLKFETVRAESQVLHNIGSVNLILIGSSRTNPVLAERQATFAYQLLEHEVQITNPQAPEEEETYKDDWGPASAQGPFYKYAILTRMPNKVSGYATTMIASNHGRAAEGVVDYLRHWENVDDLYSRMQVSVFEALPTQFQVIFRVPIHKEWGAAELGKAEPIVGRILESSGVIVRRLDADSRG